MEHFSDDHGEMRGDYERQKKEKPVSLKSVNWRRLLGYLKPYRGRMSLALVALLVSSGFGLAFPLVIVQLLDSVTLSQSYALINSLALLLVGIFLLQAGFNAAQTYLLTYIGEHIVLDLRTTLYRKLQYLSMDFYANRRVGDVISRLSSDVTQMRSVLTGVVTSLLSQLVSLVGAIVIVISLNASLTLFILAVIPVMFGIAFFFGRRVEKVSTEVQDELAGSTVVAEEGLQAIRVVKSFGRETYETGRYDGAMQKTFRASMRMAIYNSTFMGLMTFVGFSGIAAIMWFGARQVIAGELTIAQITGFLMYGITIAASLGGLAGLYSQFRAAVGGVQRVFEILDTRSTIEDTPDATVLGNVRGEISFEEVSFSYDGTSPVLKDVDLKIKAGEILALVGPSGAGKTTLFNLIPRFYDPTHGTVRIDGQDLRSVTQLSLRQQVGLVPQDTILFGGSIWENIQYGRLEASRDEVIAAARAANAHEFILQFPNQYETLVGERGANLSGGQRQRIAIARAILKDPAVLLLDEATSSLDNESEELVQDALNHLMQGRTTVIIAHRLSTIRVAHRIAVLSEGQIVELGSHDELMALDGIYARLYTMQFRNPEEELAGLGTAVPERPATPERPRGLLNSFFNRGQTGD